MRFGQDLPDIECPKCETGRLRTADVTAGSRGLLFLHQALLRLSRRLLGLRYRCGTCREFVNVPRELPRTVVGYHGCDRTFAARLKSGRLNAHDWLASEEEYDWLGQGIYFWEHAARAAPGSGRKSIIRGRKQSSPWKFGWGACLDLADTTYTRLLRQAYDDIKGWYDRNGLELPENTGGSDKKARRLDCLVLNNLMDLFDHLGRISFQTIRCPFEEGEAAFPGGNIRLQSHVQIACFRDPSCILPPVRLLPKRRN